MVCEIVEEYEVRITRACGLMELHRSYFYYKSRRDDSEVEEAIREAAVYGDGFRKIFLRLRRAGNKWNHKKVYRVYKSMSYNKRSRLRQESAFPAGFPQHDLVDRLCVGLFGMRTQVPCP